MRLNTQGPMRHEGSLVASGDVCLFVCLLFDFETGDSASLHGPDWP